MDWTWALVSTWATSQDETGPSPRTAMRLASLRRVVPGIRAPVPIFQEDLEREYARDTDDECVPDDAVAEWSRGSRTAHDPTPAPKIGKAHSEWAESRRAARELGSQASRNCRRWILA
jgi:hypothetical protein